MCLNRARIVVYLFSKNLLSSFGIEFLEIVSLVPGYIVPKYSVPAADRGLYMVARYKVTESRSCYL